MCGLFGFSDPQRRLTANRKTRLLTALANAAEVRGTDAAGIAYNSGGRLCIYKRPWPAHLMHFRIPEDAAAVMGHTRMTTQGNGKRNYNNHPFRGHAGGQDFALAHNGMISNDRTLRWRLELPSTRIETDSYVAVQLLNREQRLDLESLQAMVEQLRGMFTLTVLDEEDKLYLIKGNNPLHLYYFPKTGLYVYASTLDILHRALRQAGTKLGTSKEIPIKEGDILRIGQIGELTWGRFLTDHLWERWGYAPWTPLAEDAGYWDELKSIVGIFGRTHEDIDELRRKGFSLEEVEEHLYCGGILRKQGAVQGARAVPECGRAACGAAHVLERSAFK